MYSMRMRRVACWLSTSVQDPDVGVGDPSGTLHNPIVIDSDSEDASLA